MTTDLLFVIEQIQAILAHYGHRDKAAFMSERADTLRSPASSAEDIREAREDLHSIVMGMNGLFDLRLEPGPSGEEGASAARGTLDDLADRLYELTR
jgi:hypothetical protein